MDREPLNCVDFVLQRKAERPRAVSLTTRWQRLLLPGASATFAAGVVAGIADKAFGVSALRWPALCLLLLTVVLGTLQMVATLLAELKTMTDLERSSTRAIEQEFGEDLDTVQRLTLYPSHQLALAKSRFESGGRWLRQGTALLVGAIGKVGLLPLAITTYLAFMQAIRDGVHLGLPAWGSFGLAGIYLLGIRAVHVAHWMDGIAELYGHALDLQQSQRLAAAGSAGMSAAGPTQSAGA